MSNFKLNEIPYEQNFILHLLNIDKEIKGNKRIYFILYYIYILLY